MGDDTRFEERFSVYEKLEANFHRLQAEVRSTQEEMTAVHMDHDVFSDPEEVVVANTPATLILSWGGEGGKISLYYSPKEGADLVRVDRVWVDNDKMRVEVCTWGKTPQTTDKPSQELDGGLRVRISVGFSADTTEGEEVLEAMKAFVLLPLEGERKERMRKLRNQWWKVDTTESE